MPGLPGKPLFNDASYDWRTGPPMLLALVAAIVGLVLLYTSHPIIGGVLVALGIIATFTLPMLHDRRHIRRGEAPHAMWGKNDKNRPARLGGGHPAHAVCDRHAQGVVDDAGACPG